MLNFSERALLTDLYEVAMLQAYFMQRADKTAVFEFYVRQLPDQRNFLLAAGLAQVINYLTGLRYDVNDFAWVRESSQFDAGFIDSLHDFRFIGDMDAVMEGTLVFATSPCCVSPRRCARPSSSKVS